ncbi:MAG TPA: ATP synthase F1 subunit epsilon [Chitinophagales bacterium]|jgi:F-type H+-transporting ATPase subunit epsilon|nr:ATP synthase F1 subunit epsilon [Chitinophagales bacterium]MBP6153950.1 ATP synthase F1 subunit epsilon [Chitinophagales bacterium]HQV77839.1 ATP synthase F1 subunit epsilon [Chitinophagales bacterium]HQW78313.1 ATP synthase F1 subunit epsilon [Chitinophagales bacterium]HRB19121.1 ATP synthase F1 subunit epsilon [Chitinophagales bacterium]
MNLNILTPEANIFSGEAESVQLNGIDGKFEILNNHAPLIASLKDGIVRIKTNSGKQEFNLKSGIVEVLKNNVSVLTEGIIVEK